MSKREQHRDAGRLSRRDALKVCLLPATVVAARVLPGCSQDAGVNGVAPGSQTGAVMTPTGMPAGAAGKAAPMVVTPPSMMPAMMPVRPVMPPANMGVAGANAMPNMMGAAGGPAVTPPSMMMPMGMGAGGAGSTMGDIAGPGVAWATGGTKMIAGTYPNPFTSDPGAACKVFPAQTLGPCYTRGPMTRQDISDGLDGLPMRMSLLVVDASCKPVPNASVDVWAAGPDGAYSAYATGSICNPSTMSTMGQMFGRGVQMSDEAGQLQFDTVFPGWYRGRTLHVHFTVRVDGRDFVTSQLYFEDKLVDEIHMQGHYKARGMRDTNNMSDGIFRSGGATAEQILFQTAKRPDGVLHAWKVISIG